MIAVLVRRNARQNARLVAALASGAFALQLMIVHIGAAFEPTMADMIAALPPMFRGFITGMEEFSFGAVVAFGYKHPATLAMGLSLALLLATQPAAERERGLLDLWLARPLARARYLAAVVVSVVLGALVLPVAQFLGGALGLMTVQLDAPPAWGDFVLSALGQAPFYLAFGGIALLASVRAPRRGVAVARTVAIVLVMYVVDAFAPVFAPLQRIEWLSLFDYFRPVEWGTGGSPGWSPVLLLLVFGVTAGLAFRRFDAADL